MGTFASVYVVRVLEQCCFNSVPDHFNGQAVNFFLKPTKVTVWALKGSGTVLKQHCSITLTIWESLFAGSGPQYIKTPVYSKRLLCIGTLLLTAMRCAPAVHAAHRTVRAS